MFDRKHFLIIYIYIFYVYIYSSVKNDLFFLCLVALENESQQKSNYGQRKTHKILTIFRF